MSATATTTAPAGPILVPYGPFLRQEAFHACPAGEVLFGGAAGPGKSLALLWEMFHQAVETPENEVIIFRRTFPQLEATLIQRSLALFPRQVAEYNSQKHVWEFRHRSRLRFGHAQHEHSIYDYQGQEFGGIGIDEVTEWADGMYRFTLRLLRTTNPQVWPRMRCASNPIGIGYEWAKLRWVQPVLDGTVAPDEVWRPAPTDDDPQPMTRAYIPAKHGDNPALLKHDPGYVGRLLQLPRHERVALLEGSWEIPAHEGQPFPPEFVLAAQQGACGLEPARWRCPSCTLEWTNVLGAAFCLVCRRPLRAREYLTTWDLARKRDWTVGITLDVSESPAQLVAFERFHRVPWPEVARRIEARSEAYPGRTLVDSTGVGDPVMEFLKCPVEGILFSPKSKTNMIQALVMALERGEIRGPSNTGVERLWQELYAYRWNDENLVQDCVMALAMAADGIQSGTPRIWSLG